MAPHQRRRKLITLDLDGVQYECQINDWKLTPPANVGDKKWTYCPDGEYREEVDDDDWTLDLKWLSDWRVGGLDRVLHAAAAQEAPDNQLTFSVVLHPGVTGESSTWSGVIIAKAPPLGGEARTTEESEMSFTGVGDFPVPVYT